MAGHLSKAISAARKCVLVTLVLLALQTTAQAEIGIVIYGSKGLDARRTNSGHIALIVTDLCARGIDQVRECSAEEARGVVITKYPNLAAGYDRTVFVAPLLAHFNAVLDPQAVPVLSSGNTLKALQVQYWQNQLRSYLPPLTQERYDTLLEEQTAFSAGKLFHKLITLEFLAKVLSSSRGHHLGDSIAMVDPKTHELIPNGSWREAIGVQYVRDSTTITVPAEVSDELKLVEFISDSQHVDFNTLSNNCSDFVKSGLLAVFASRGFHFRARGMDPADAWITSPLLVATSFLNYAKDNNLPVRVAHTPMLAGTTRPSAPITAVSQGALVPSPDQGKLAFALKVYINALNPLIGTTAFVVTKSSRYANLEKLAHEQGASTTPELIGHPSGDRANLRKEQVRAFGTAACWDRKRKDFASLTADAKELGALTKEEQSKLLTQDRPFLLPRFYESLAKTESLDAPLMTGVNLCLTANDAGDPEPDWDAADTITTENVPTRLELQTMGRSPEGAERLKASRLMIALINYDLASQAKNRRRAKNFDEDWKLYLQVAEATGVRVAPEMQASLEDCSVNELAQNAATVDAIQTDLGAGHQVNDWFRRLMTSPLR